MDLQENVPVAPFSSLVLRKSTHNQILPIRILLWYIAQLGKLSFLPTERGQLQGLLPDLALINNNKKYVCSGRMISNTVFNNI